MRLCGLRWWSEQRGEFVRSEEAEAFGGQVCRKGEAGNGGRDGGTGEDKAHPDALKIGGIALR